MSKFNKFLPGQKTKKLANEIESKKAECGESIGKLLGILGVKKEISKTTFKGTYRENKDNDREIEIETAANDPERNRRGLFRIGPKAIKYTLRYSKLNEHDYPIIEDIDVWAEDAEGKMQRAGSYAYINDKTRLAYLNDIAILLHDVTLLADNKKLEKIE